MELAVVNSKSLAPVTWHQQKVNNNNEIQRDQKLWKPNPQFEENFYGGHYQLKMLLFVDFTFTIDLQIVTGFGQPPCLWKQWSTSYQVGSLGFFELSFNLKFALKTNVPVVNHWFKEKQGSDCCKPWCGVLKITRMVKLKKK